MTENIIQLAASIRAMEATERRCSDMGIDWLKSPVDNDEMEKFDLGYEVPMTWLDFRQRVTQAERARIFAAESEQRDIPARAGAVTSIGYYSDKEYAEESAADAKMIAEGEMIRELKNERSATYGLTDSEVTSAFNDLFAGPLGHDPL